VRMPVSDELRDRRLFVTLALERAAVRSGHRPDCQQTPTDPMELDAMDRISRVERRKVWEHSCRRDQQRSSRSLLKIA